MAATVSSSSAALGFAVRPDEGRDLAEMGAHVIAAANEQLGLSDREGGGWDHISFCQFAGPLTREGNELQGSNACVIHPGKIDRSPTGTGCSAQKAVLSAHGQMAEGDVGPVHHRLGVRLPDRAPSHDSRTADHCANHFGPAWITGVSQYMLDPADPWPSGYRLSDIWSRIREAI
jgi:proline racemase